MATKVLGSGSRRKVEVGSIGQFKEMQSDLALIYSQVENILPTIKTKDGSNLEDTIEKIKRVKSGLNEIEGAMILREKDYLRQEAELEKYKHRYDSLRIISEAIIGDIRDERGSMQEKLFSLEESISERLDQIGAHLTKLTQNREDSEYKVTKLMVTNSLDHLFSTLSPRELVRLQRKTKPLDEVK